MLPVNSTCVLYLTPDELYTLNPVSQQITPIRHVRDTQLGEFNEIKFSTMGDVWIAGKAGIAYLFKEDDAFSSSSEWKEFLFPDSLNIENLIHPVEHQSGELFGIAASITDQTQFIVRLDGTMWETIDCPINKNIRFAWRGEDEKIWVLHGPQLRYSLVRIEENKDEIVEDKNFYAGGWVLDMAFEPSGSFWISTMEGIIRHAPAVWRTPVGIKDVKNSVHEIFEDQKGRLWFDCIDALAVYSESRWKVFPYPENRISLIRANTSLCSLPDGRIVNFTEIDEPPYFYPMRMLSFNPATEEFEFIEHPEKRAFRILSPSRDGQVWVQTVTDGDDFKYRFEKYDGKVFTPVAELDFDDRSRSGDYVYQVLERKNGDLWLCGTDKIGWFSGGKIREMSKGEGSPFEYGFYSIHEIDQDKLWFGSARKVIEYDGTHWEIIDQEFNQVNAIFQSINSDKWVATNSGLYQYHQGSWIIHDSQDGLPSSTILTVFEDSQNRIWAGTTNGISLYHPESDRDPPMTIIPEDKNITKISPNGEAQFVFYGLDKWKYTEKHRLLYSHRIDSGTWSSFTSSTVTTHTGLSPGSHHFEVRAMDRNWNIDPEAAMFQFKVMLPWYKEPAFWGIIFVGSMLILLFASYAINRHFKLHEANKNLSQFNTELQEANAQLLQLDQMKSAFVSQASHDLRTPLTAIKGSLDNLLMGIAGELNEKQAKVMTRATKSVDRLTNLINDVLDLNRIETGRIVLEKTDIPFKTLIENIINENRPAAEQKLIRLEFVASEGDYALHIDGGKMERVVGELVSNAIKYTPENGKITVSLQQREDCVELSVQDSGIGMTEEECGKIFDRFYRTQASQTMAKGSGLGLSIAKELVEMHNGTLSVTSRKGAGATFTMTLPKSSQGENHA